MSALKEKKDEADDDGESSFKQWVVGWVRDFVEVGVTVGVVLVVLHLVLGAHSIVPLVVVTSGSMVHEPGDDSWRQWMTSRGIAHEQIDEFPMGNGFQRGDMIVTYYPEGAGLGDVIVYERDLIHAEIFGRSDPIIHRVTGVVEVADGTIVNASGTLDCMTLADAEKFVAHVERCQEGYEKCQYPAVPEDDRYRMYWTKGDHNLGSDQCSKNGGISIPVNEAQVTSRALVRLPYVGYLKIILNAFLQLLFFWV